MAKGRSTRRFRGQLRATLDRCARCFLHLRLCLCASLEPLPVATRVVVLRHRKEAHKPTNTGRLVPLTLMGGEIRVFGARDEELDTTGLFTAERRTVLLFPTPDSRPLESEAADPRPVTMIVPDSDWRRAQKLALREEKLADAQHVHLPSGPPSMYRLRHHPDPRYLATFEAVARALGILEGAEVQERLEQVFRVMVDRTLWSRGQLASEKVTGGLPEPI
ncbi:MAG: DTW domain-containing protein [Planctomycetes bacterium]|nr:DTW domain-containing protein [Planctomycetota bacterium]